MGSFLSWKLTQQLLTCFEKNMDVVYGYENDNIYGPYVCMKFHENSYLITKLKQIKYIETVNDCVYINHDFIECILTKQKKRNN